MANFAGNVHGGTILQLLDQVAYTSASRYARTYVVTLAVDRVLFREAVHVGELVTFSASVNCVGRTSMEIGIRVQTENIRKRHPPPREQLLLHLVAVDANGKPVPLPPLALDTAALCRRFEEAKHRRAAQRAAFAGAE